MVGSALLRRLRSEDCEIVSAPRRVLDLRDVQATERWVMKERPHAVFVAAAKVGGILANESYPADFLMDNLQIEQSIIQASYRAGVEKLLFLGSSCIYPRLAAQPITEAALLDGPLEPTNQWYALAKIAGIKMCQAFRQQHGCDFISAMPTNLYGPNDNFDLRSSHVLPALIRKAYDAKQADRPWLEVWGSGKPLREFLHADDCADALVFLMKNYSDTSHVNVGTGSDVSIRELATLIADTVGYRGSLKFDASKPDGTPRKLLDVTRLHDLGWSHRIDLPEGIRDTYAWFLDDIGADAGRILDTAHA